MCVRGRERKEGGGMELSRLLQKQKNEKNSYKLMQRVNLDRFILQKEKFDFIFLEKKKIINIED